MKQYERFIIYGLVFIFLILVGWFIDSKNKTERYKCWNFGGDSVGAYILDTKTGHLYVAYAYRKIRDLGAIDGSNSIIDLSPLTNKEKDIFDKAAEELNSKANK